MVRKSLRRALALGTVRDEAAVGTARLEPAHGANAGSGKLLFRHFPLLEWHTALLVPVRGGGCRDTSSLLALTPARCLSGTALEREAGMGQFGQSLVFCAACALGSPPALALPVLLCGCGHCPLAGPFPCPGWASREPLELGRDVPFGCQVLHIWRGERMVSPVGSRAPRLLGSGCRAVPCPVTLALPCKQRCPALGSQ